MRLFDANRLSLGSAAAMLSLVAGLSMSVAPTEVLASAATPPLMAQAVDARAGGALQVTAQTAPPDAHGRYSMIVRFKEPALATYSGGIPGLAATSPRARGETRIDTRAPHAVAYLNYLANRQASHLGEIGSLVRRAVQPQFQYLNVLNAAALRLTLDEAAKVQALDFVQSVHLDELRELATDIGPGLIGAPAFWDGQSTSGVPNKGEGIVIGIIDTGFVHDHPSFAEVAEAGTPNEYIHTNPNGAGVFFGVCVDNPSLCNNKLIGSYNFHTSAPDSTDGNGHGTHVAGTAAGNPVTATYAGLNVPITGVAPRANLINYKVCHPTCPLVSSVAAVNQAIADNVDVLNFSIGGGDNPWNDIVDLAFLDAFNAGIFTAAAGGNSGPGASTVAHTGPWNATVANSTHGRIFGNGVDAAGLVGMLGMAGSGPALEVDLSANLVDALTVDAGNALGCNPFPANAFDGAIALIQRGECTFISKVNNAVAAGAVGVLTFNNAAGPPISMGGLEDSTVPSLMLDQASGLAVRAAIGPASTATMYAGSSSVLSPAWADGMATLSSRGPSQWDLIKPDFAAPGTNILAPYITNAHGQYNAISGTSMASPHAAGAAALLIAEHPTWSPAAIKSAMALSANSTMRKENFSTPADPFDRGSGRLDLAEAARITLVMNETHANFVAANPASGDPRTLNLPSIMNRSCIGGCSFTRSVTSVSVDPQDYVVQVTAAPGVTIEVTPNAFTLGAGATQALTIDVSFDFNVATAGAWTFGEIRLREPVGPTTTHLTEGFENATFPPTGWSRFDVDGGGTQWARTTASFASGTASARHGFSAAGNQDGWLVTPVVALGDVPALGFMQRAQWPADYGKHSVWVSTASCDPAGGDFVELAEAGTNGSDGNVWAARAYSLDAYANQSVCVGFRYEGNDAGNWFIDGVVVSSTDAPSFPTLSLPVALIGLPAVPTIELDPEEVVAQAEVGSTDPVIRELEVANSGPVDLNWSLAANAEVVLWEQTTTANNGIASGFFTTTPANTGVYSADDFEVTEPVALTRLFFDGFVNSATLAANSSAIRFYVYSDAQGNPAGHPEDGQSSHVWTATLAPTAAGVDVTGNKIRLNLADAGLPAVELQAGRYWLIAAPVFPTTSPRWNWFAATNGPALSDARIIAPNGTLGVPTTWTSIATLLNNPVFAALTFRVNGSVGCGADWLDVAPTNGTVAPAGTDNLTVTFDPTGLAPGVHTARICIASDDTSNPVAVVPVSFAITETPAISLSETSLSASAPHGASTSVSFDIGNTANGVLNWGLLELQAPAGAEYGYSGRRAFSAPVGTLRGETAQAPTSAADRVVLPSSSHVLATLSEGFEDLALLPGAGWAFVNNSQPIGSFSWFQGNPAAWEAHQGPTNSYASVNFQSGAGVATLSNWMLTPEVELRNGTQLTFWTRRQASAFEDRLQVRLSTAGGSVGVGSTATSVGDFTSLLLDINPSYAANGYPRVWTQYTVTVTGLSAPTTGRFAFRYFVENGGPSGANSDRIGIDTVSIEQPCGAVNTPWLSVTPSSGATAADDFDTVTMDLDAAALGAGTHQAELCVLSDDPQKPVVLLPVSFEVTQAAQSITFDALADRTMPEGSFVLAASASSGLDVAFSSLTGTVCSVTADTVDLLAVGTCTIRASQPGNTNFQPAANVDRSFQVSQATQTISFAALPDRTMVEGSFTLSATASSGLDVAFASQTTAVCTVTGTTVDLLSAGACTIRASQAGDASYLPATDVERTFQVSQVAQTISFAALPDRSMVEGSFTLSATASSSLTVSFASLTETVCEVSGATVDLLEPGTCTIRASQDGDASYLAAADVERSFEVLDPEVTVLPGSLPRGHLDMPYEATFTATADGGATGPFTFAVVAGELPPGLELASDGELTGAPTETGEFSFTVRAEDSTPPSSGGPISGQRGYTLQIVDDTVFINGFEANSTARSIELQAKSLNLLRLPLIEDIAASGGEGELAIAELTLDGQRVGVLVARCSASQCEVQLQWSRADAKSAESGWWLIDADPFEISVEVGSRYVIGATRN
jgi:subtilisin family serine protease